ncbi:head-tail connector protein [Bosea sp. FBZP-16]|uniref:head-tail connector protein n=1 Tax=Bosea sp. FBZP-16 TaxID=2065382 RepID=UPI000C30D113|nr:head-tail connector protein [Bosea sp. FBZP-16]
MAAFQQVLIMDIITLAEFQAHTRISDDTENEEAQALVDAANGYVTGLIDPADDYDPPADVKLAALQIAAHWWERRETAGPEALSDIPLNASAILVNHRAWSFGR